MLVTTIGRERTTELFFAVSTDHAGAVRLCGGDVAVAVDERDPAAVLRPRRVRDRAREGDLLAANGNLVGAVGDQQCSGR